MKKYYYMMDNIIEKRELKLYISRVLNMLEKDLAGTKDQLMVSIIKDIFGIDNDKLSMVEVAKKYGLTYDTVRSYKDRGLRKLRHPRYSRLMIDYHHDRMICY